MLWLVTVRICSTEYARAGCQCLPRQNLILVSMPTHSWVIHIETARGVGAHNSSSNFPSRYLLCPARLLDTLDNAASVWKDVKSQAPTTQQNLVPLTKLWSQKTEEEMETYQSVVADKVHTPQLVVVCTHCIDVLIMYLPSNVSHTYRCVQRGHHCFCSCSCPLARL